MRKFNVGDKIILNRDFWKNNKGDKLTIHKCYLSVLDRQYYVQFKELLFMSSTHNCEASACDLIKKANMTETDFLDAFKENFKDGT